MWCRSRAHGTLRETGTSDNNWCVLVHIAWIKKKKPIWNRPAHDRVCRRLRTTVGHTVEKARRLKRYAVVTRTRESFIIIVKIPLRHRWTWGVQVRNFIWLQSRDNLSRFYSEPCMGPYLWNCFRIRTLFELLYRTRGKNEIQDRVRQ